MLRPTVTMPDLDGLMRGLEDGTAAVSTAAMRDATAGLKQELRAQVTGAGLGGRLANTWRGETYPNQRNSLNPAGYVYSNAPAIISSFAEGATIAPRGGKKYLWIPTRSVPRASAQGRASSTKRMNPEQVLASFGLDDFIMRKGKGGHLLAFIAEKRGLTKRGALRKVRKGRLGHGDDSQLILMFTLTPTVKMPKPLDLDGAADHWASAYARLFEDHARRP